jgi:hypothetical protein
MRGKTTNKSAIFEININAIETQFSPRQFRSFLRINRPFKMGGMVDRSFVFAATHGDTRKLFVLAAYSD